MSAQLEILTWRVKQLAEDAEGLARLVLQSDIYWGDPDIAEMVDNVLSWGYKYNYDGSLKGRVE